MANRAAGRRDNIQKTAIEARPIRTAPRFCLTLKKNDLRMKKIKWSTVKKVLQVVVAIISTVVGTVAVQASVF